MKFLYFLTSLVIVFNISAKKIINFKEPRDALKIVKKYLPDAPIILEAGAFDGNDSTYLAKFWPNATIYSFEPVPEIYALFSKNTQSFSQIKGFTNALADSCGKKTFYVSSDENTPDIPSQSSSLLAPKEHLTYAPNVIFKRKIDVECLTIDTWAELNNITNIDLLWLDLQGSELEVLKASPMILKNVKAIITEVEFVEAYEGQSLYTDIKDWLEKEGFTLIGLSKTYGWFGDAIFVRI